MQSPDINLAGGVILKEFSATEGLKKRIIPDNISADGEGGSMEELGADGFPYVETIDLDVQIDALYEKIDREGLDCVFSSYFTSMGRFLDLPRKCELKAVINRMRKISFVSGKNGKILNCRR